MAPQDENRLVVEAIAAIEAHNDVLALALLDQLGASNPDHVMVNCGRAIALLRQNKVRQAIVEARRATQLHPDSVLAWRVLYQTAWRLNNCGQAQLAFERALELSNRDPDILRRYANFMAESRSPKVAEPIVREALAIDGNSPAAIAALGWVQFRQGQYAEAEATLQRGLSIDPNHVVLRTYMASLLRCTNRDAKADAMVRLLAENPEAQEFVEDDRVASRARKASQAILSRSEVQSELFDERRSRLISPWLIRSIYILGFAFVGIAMVLAGPPRNPRDVAVPAVVVGGIIVRLWMSRDR